MAEHEDILAFNGLHLPLPPGWDIVSMGKRYLCLGPDMRPALELKWEPITGSFSMKKHMKRVVQSYGKKGRVVFHSPPLADTDKTGAPLTSVAFFEWSSTSIRDALNARGEGGIVYDQECKAALVFQCRAPLSLDSPEAKIVFDGLRLQNGSVRHWSIYDIRAELPDWLQLDAYKFSPGLFRLDFRGPKQSRFQLFRLGPANVILENTLLETWAENFFSTLHPAHGPSLLSREHGTVTLDLSGKTPFVERLVPWRRTHGIFLARRDEQANRILALCASSRRPLDIQPLKEIFARYVAVPKKRPTPAADART